MTVSQIISFLRTQTNVSVWQLSDAELLSYINIAYHDLENAIQRYVKEDFFWNRYTTDVVANQWEYMLKNPDWTTIGMKKLKRVEIKYWANDSFRTVVKADTLNNYNNSEDWLANYVNKSTPIYTLSDNSVFLFPTPWENVTDWLVLYTINSLIDLTTSWTEADIFPWYWTLRDFHHTIAEWARQYVFKAKGQLNEKNDAKNEYEMEKQKMISILNGRIEVPVEWTLPSVRQFYIK